MKRQLVQWMVCPTTAGRLTLRVAQECDGEILEGELVSASGRRYPITRGVPRLIPPDLQYGDRKETEEAFTSKWQRAKDFGHEERSRSFYLNWYLQRYKFETLDALRVFLSGKRRILDAGTGVGRDTRLYADNSQAAVFGVDVSGGIDSAFDQLRSYPNAHLIQADLTQLPFPRDFFDFIACDQVLHHTPDAGESFRQLVTRLAPGGDLSIYVYRKKAPIRELVDDYLRDAVSRMSVDEAWSLAEQLTELGRVLTEIKATITVPAIPALGVQGGAYDVQRFIYWHILKCYWNPSLRDGDNVITNFDWYRPRYASRQTADEVRGWFTDAGLEIITFDEGEAGVSVRGRKRQ